VLRTAPLRQAHLASHFAPLLGRSEDLKLNYGQLWHRLNDPLVLGTQPLLALPCDRVLNVALAPENHLADVEPVSDDAVGALAGAIDGARGPLPTTRRRDTLAIVAVVFAPLLCATILKPPETSAAGNPSKILEIYRGLLSWAVKAKGTTIAATLAVFVASLLALPLIPSQFFPSSDRPELLVDMRLPQNASIFASQAVAERLDEKLLGDDDVARWSTYVGRGAIRFYLPLDVQLPNDFFAQAVVVAKDVPARKRLQKKLETILAQDFPNMVGRISPLELGPPVGWPVQYRVSGPDIGLVREIALKLANVIAANPQAEHVNFDWIEPMREVRIMVDQDEARQLGLSSEALASVLNTVVSGNALTQVRDDIYLIDVVVRATDEQRISLATLRNMQVPLQSGRTVPLGQFASFEYAQDQPVVWRRDRVPTLTVQANVSGNTLPEIVVDTLAPNVEVLRKELPNGYAIVEGGTVEESRKSQASVVAVVPLMLLIMLSVLMVELRSFQRLGLVLSIGPLGLIGVVGALLISRRPLGFVAILGILALLGMITKNAVILIGQIEGERAQGKDLETATIDASSTRFRPIMLTAISTVLGMIPIAPTVFWGPMAFAIMGGLLVATLLTLVFLPALYVAWFSWTGSRRSAQNLGTSIRSLLGSKSIIR